MRRYWLVFALLCGCSSSSPSPRPQTDLDKRLFGPVSMKMDTFSKVRSFSGGATPDGVDALVEFDDRFDDRAKAAGSIYFELFTYRAGWPDPRGGRIANPWSASLLTYDEQKAHWDRASGAYDFQLACDGLEWDKDYVLSATFESADGQRFFAQIILPAVKTQKNGKAPSTDQSALPSPRYPQP